MRAPVVVLLALLALALGAVVTWRIAGGRMDRAAELRRAREELLAARESLQALVRTQDSLRALVQRVHGAPGGPASIASAFDIEQLRNQGLADPVGTLRADLTRHREVIPYKGILGGTMGFYDTSAVVLLDRRWVYAHFGDGHYEGQGVFEFSVGPGGRIRWKTVAATAD